MTIYLRGRPVQLADGEPAHLWRHGPGLHRLGLGGLPGDAQELLQVSVLISDVELFEILKEIVLSDI